MDEGVQRSGDGPGGRYDVFHTDCPARTVVDHVTSRWGVWVLIALRNNSLRFYELRESIRGISEKMLAQTLRALVEDGLVWREVEPTTPPQVTYGLTEFGRDIGEPLTELFDRITQRLPSRGAEGADGTEGADGAVTAGAVMAGASPRPGG
ncbi:helix-turn-helix domain-containing protein [Streptomyces carpaticus]|uniref:winged helix-turn-helix transcriptional regulator n=1 Tax=Streptomyces carpaticus TaxID=285558 RepID=UPI0031FA07E8